MTTASSVHKALADKHIHFIGGGNMAASIFGGLIEQGFNPQQISVKELNSERAQALEAQYGLKASSDLTAEHADVVLLAVKPQVMDSVLAELRKNDPDVASGVFWKIWPWYLRVVCPVVIGFILWRSLL